jgi:hypothetical protein
VIGRNDPSDFALIIVGGAIADICVWLAEEPHMTDGCDMLVDIVFVPSFELAWRNGMNANGLLTE